MGGLSLTKVCIRSPEQNPHTHTKITLQIQVGDVAPFAVSLSSIYKALDLTPFPYKLALGILICDPSIQEVKAEISVLQSHPIWLYDEFKANLDCLKKTNKRSLKATGHRQVIEGL